MFVIKNILVFSLAFAYIAPLAAQEVSWEPLDRGAVSLYEHHYERSTSDEQKLLDAPTCFMDSRLVGKCLNDDAATLQVDSGTKITSELFVAMSRGILSGRLLFEGKYAKAESNLKQALATFERHAGLQNESTLRANTSLAFIYLAQGRYSEAELIFQQVLATRQNTLGPDDLTVATSLYNLAILYRTQGRYAEAEQFLVRSIAIDKKVRGVEDYHVAQPLEDLSLVFRKTQRAVLAQTVEERAVKLMQNAPGRQWQALEAQAGALFHESKYDRAVPIAESALRLAEQTKGRDHPEVGICLYHLGLLYDILGRYEAADAANERSSAIFSRILGSNHPDTAEKLHNRAELYFSQGRYAKAEPLFDRALAIREAAMGPDHPDVAMTLRGLAKLYQKTSREGEANTLEQRAAVIDARTR